MSTETELFLVRHGETEWSRDGRHTSRTDLELTEAGLAEGQAVASALDPTSFGLILTSPRIRARRTAELAGFTKAAEPIVDDDLVEWDYGDYEGLTTSEISDTVPGWTVWDHPMPGGESAEQVMARLQRVVDRVQDSGVARAICFGHGHALRVLTLCWLGFEIGEGVRFPLDTGAISVLGHEKGQPALRRWNAPAR